MAEAIPIISAIAPAAIQGIGNLMGKSASADKNAGIDAKMNPLTNQIAQIAQGLLSGGGAYTEEQKGIIKSILGDVNGLTGPSQYAGDFSNRADSVMQQLQGMVGQKTSTEALDQATNRSALQGMAVLRGKLGGGASSIADSGLSQFAENLYSGLARDKVGAAQADRQMDFTTLGQIGQLNQGKFGALDGSANQRQQMRLGGLSQVGGMYGDMSNQQNSRSGQAIAALTGLAQLFNGQRPDFKGGYDFSYLGPVLASMNKPTGGYSTQPVK